MTDTVRPGFLVAFRKILRPLVRILIRHGVSFGELAEVLKTVFVEVAARDFTLPERKVSQSRIAILTGLTRKEVAKQEGIIASGGVLDFPSNLNRVTRVLVAWHTDPEFTGPYGMPLDLPFDSTSPANFMSLVRKHSGDMAARAMLDELLRVGAVERLASGSFKVLARAYIPRDFDPDALHRFGEVVRDFIHTYEFNMDKRPGLGRFERIVFADDGLREELMPAFNALIRAKGPQLLNELDNWLSAQESTSTSRTRHSKKLKTGVGIYHYVTEE
jgi:Family of unknown function (DUF6502)